MKSFPNKRLCRRLVGKISVRYLHFWYLHFVGVVLPAEVVPRPGPGRGRRTADRGRGTVLAPVDGQVSLHAGDRRRNGAGVRIQQTGRGLAQFCIIEGRLYIILISGSNSIGTNTRIRTGKVHCEAGGGDGFRIDRPRFRDVAPLVRGGGLRPVRVRRTVNGTRRGVALRVKVLAVRVLVGDESRTARSVERGKKWGVFRSKNTAIWSKA